MATSTNRLVTLSLGAVLTLATLVACLSYAGMREGPSLSLKDLEHSQTVLMSCAREDGPLSGAELLWCADASSPLCLPALPASERVELFDAPPIAVPHYQLEISPMLSWALPSWERPLPEERPRSQDRARLERPPRA